MGVVQEIGKTLNLRECQNQEFSNAILPREWEMISRDEICPQMRGRLPSMDHVV